MNAKAILWPQGRYNPGGITQVFYGYKEDFLSFPVLGDPETALTLESLVSYATAIIMKAGKQLFQLYCTVEQGEIKSTMVGPRDGKGYENMLEISFPGSEAEFLGFKAAAANRELIFFVKEKNGKVRVLGNLEDPAFFENDDSTSGKAIADGRTSKLTFKASGATPAPIYTPALTSLLAPAA